MWWMRFAVYGDIFQVSTLGCAALVHFTRCPYLLYIWTCVVTGVRLRAKKPGVFREQPMYRIQNSRITTVSAFKKELATMDVSEPVLVTQNGDPLYVVQDPAQFEMQQEQLALMRLLSFAEKDVAAGRTVSSAGLRNGLRNLGSSDSDSE